MKVGVGCCGGGVWMVGGWEGLGGLHLFRWMDYLV